MKKMKISMTTGALSRRFGENAALNLLNQAGFEAVDYSGFKYGAPQIFKSRDKVFFQYYKELGIFAKNIGIEIHQTHAPMPMYSFDKEKLKVLKENTVSAIYASAYLGAEYVVFHPAVIPGRIGEDDMQRGAELTIQHFSDFIPILKETGIKGAIENIYSRDTDTGEICPTVCSFPKDLAYVSDTLGDCFCNCLDIGHAHLTKQPPEQMIKILQKRVEVIHLHDNDGITDCHTAPFEKNIDWKSVCQALDEINYSGTFNFEADEFLSNIPDDMIPFRLSYLYDLGLYLTKQIEN